MANHRRSIRSEALQFQAREEERFGGQRRRGVSRKKEEAAAGGDRNMGEGEWGSDGVRVRAARDAARDSGADSGRIDRPKHRLTRERQCTMRRQGASEQRDSRSTSRRAAVARVFGNIISGSHLPNKVHRRPAASQLPKLCPDNLHHIARAQAHACVAAASERPQPQGTPNERTCQPGTMIEHALSTPECL